MSAEPPAGTVVAAGGVVSRRRAGGELEVLLVHRPRYGDWSLPKGKLDPGESAREAALREIEEETGLRCRLGSELGSTSYRDPRGRPKVVHWWTMEPLSGEFVPGDEVDAVRWVTLGEAAGVLSYERDVELLARLDPGDPPGGRHGGPG